MSPLNLYLVLLTFLLNALHLALAAPTPSSRCTTTSLSPSVQLLRPAMSGYLSTCTQPASVPGGKACITLASGNGYIVSLCGWKAKLESCNEAVEAVEVLIGDCETSLRVEGEVKGRWGTVYVQRKVGGSA